jgi:hypothetical protein
MNLRWRKVQVIDESWYLEVEEPTYVCVKYEDGSEDEVDGWRPVACVWNARKLTDPKPWTGALEGNLKRWYFREKNYAKRAIKKRYLKENL